MLNNDEYFQGPKDQVINALKQEIYSLQCKIGDYDILRKNMIEMELKYRDMVMNKAQQEHQFRDNFTSTSNKNGDLTRQLEIMKEQIHL